MGKTKKGFYGADEYKFYNIHKATLISFNPTESAKAIQNIFGKANVSSIQTPPDKVLAKRGIKWVRFLKGEKAEFHFVPPKHEKYDKILRDIVKMEDTVSPLKLGLVENHVGIYVPDLTPVILSSLRNNYKCFLGQRGDGVHQFYVNIKGCLDYLDIDSVKLDLDKIQKEFKDFKSIDFGTVQEIQDKNVKKFEKKTRKRRNEKIYDYSDPNHKEGARKIIINGRKVTVEGRDTPKGKIWRIRSKLDKNNNTILDFSVKGGPKRIKAKISKEKVVFGDGNIWYSSDL